MASSATAGGAVRRADKHDVAGAGLCVGCADTAGQDEKKPLKASGFFWLVSVTAVVLLT